MSLPAIITTERLHLRQFEPRDLAPYVAYYTGARTAGVGGPKPRYIVVERFMAMIGQWALRGYGRYAVTTGDAGFGHVGVMHIDEADPPELTWTLWDAAEERKGYATEAARAVLKAWTGAPLLARVVPNNARSLGVAERLGMQELFDAPKPSYGGETRDFISAGSLE